MRRSSGMVLLILILCAVSPPAAVAASIQLEVSGSPITFGGEVHVSGVIEPATAGELVTIVDADDQIVARGMTGPHGGFAATFRAERTARIRARWGDVTSAPVAVGVRPRITVVLWQARLFDRVMVTGRVRPAVGGSRVRVSLLHAGLRVARRWTRVHDDGRFRTDLPVSLPGRYRAVVRAEPPDLRPGTGTSIVKRTPLPSLADGASGVFVGLLERRLVELGYRLDGVDGRFDERTGDAVVAFHKVQRMDRRFSVVDATWRALATPVRPRPRFRWPAYHLEIDQTRQVLYTVRDGRILWISHVSTGKPSTPTYDGTYRIYRKVAGTYNGLSYPSYFDGGRAIHGWKDVPTYNASHGCVRFPLWNAVWIFRHAPIDSAVRIYH